MEIEGCLHITLRPHEEGIRRIGIHSTRPLTAVRVFHGKPVDETLKLLPMLYHVCGVAQASAAVAACEEAMSVEPVKQLQSAREMLVWIETAREHLWRIMVDWADVLREEKNRTGMFKIHQFLPELKKALFVDGEGFQLNAQVRPDIVAVEKCVAELRNLIKEIVFAIPVENWLEHSDWDDVQGWMSSADTIATRMLRKLTATGDHGVCNASIPFLPPMDDDSLHEMLDGTDADVFITQPVWEGVPHETSVLSRQQGYPLIAGVLSGKGNGLLVRILARLVELASIPGRLDTLLQDLSTGEKESRQAVSFNTSGVGLGQVEAARGRLVHRLEVDNGVIRRYQIVAPTEWNFHPQGVAAQLLQTLVAEDEEKLLQQAGLFINAIDPCVRYEMTVQ